jgi:hypothetical protein
MLICGFCIEQWNAMWKHCNINRLHLLKVTKRITKLRGCNYNIAAFY